MDETALEEKIDEVSTFIKSQLLILKSKQEKNRSRYQKRRLAELAKNKESLLVKTLTIKPGDIVRISRYSDGHGMRRVLEINGNRIRSKILSGPFANGRFLPTKDIYYDSPYHSTFSITSIESVLVNGEWEFI